jgi:hypothetical protein
MRLIRKNDDASLSADKLEDVVQRLQADQLTATERINLRVAQLHSSGLYRDALVLGPVVLERPYGGCQNQESHEVIQAGLSSRLGLVAIYWDSDEYLLANFDPPAALLDLAKERMVPIAQAESIVVSLVTRLADDLLTNLLAQVVVHLDNCVLVPVDSGQ